MTGDFETPQDYSIHWLQTRVGELESQLADSISVDEHNARMSDMNQMLVWCQNRAGRAENEANLLQAQLLTYLNVLADAKHRLEMRNAPFQADLIRLGEDEAERKAEAYKSAVDLARWVEMFYNDLPEQLKPHVDRWRETKKGLKS